MDDDEHMHRILARFRELERRRLAPAPLTGETRAVRTDFEVLRLDRARVEATLRLACPRGLDYLYHHLQKATMSACDFEDACDHFGLRGVLKKITPQDVDAEVRARRERGDPPSTGPLPLFMDEIMSRERADARIAIVERRIAGARAVEVPAPPSAA